LAIAFFFDKKYLAEVIFNILKMTAPSKETIEYCKDRGVEGTTSEPAPNYDPDCICVNAYSSMTGLMDAQEAQKLSNFMPDR